MKIKNLLAVATLAALSNLSHAAGEDAVAKAAAGVAEGIGAAATQAATKDVGLQAVAAKFRAM